MILSTKNSKKHYAYYVFRYRVCEESNRTDTLKIYICKYLKYKWTLFPLKYSSETI